MKTYVQATPVAVSVPFNNSTNGFTATNVQTAIEEARAYPRSALRSDYNGTVNNNDWLGPSELLPNTPLMVVPFNCRIQEISWSNTNTNVAFRIQFRTVSKTGTIFYTLTVTSPNSGSGVASGINFALPAGTTVWAQYLDDGTNCLDFDLIMWIQRTP